MAQRKAPKPSAPTDRQSSIIEFMLEYQEEHGAPPTMREICDHIGASSTNSATCHLHALLTKGLVRHYPGRSRGWVAKEKA
jgi:repressor LexA